MREKVVIPERKAMTPARKRRIWARVGGKCWMCGQPVELSGPGVVYDHKRLLEFGGPDADDDDNIFPLHADPCNKLKCKADAARLAKMRRQEKMADKQPTGTLKSRGFPKDGPKRKIPSRPFPRRNRKDKP